MGVDCRKGIVNCGWLSVWVMYVEFSYGANKGGGLIGHGGMFVCFCCS